jgi:hypothetical protein
MSRRLKDITKALWRRGKAEGADDCDGSWPDFESWIRRAIGGDFTWKVRPRDNPEKRQMVADSIAESTRKNGGTFPERDAFIERVKE